MLRGPCGREDRDPLKQKYDMDKPRYEYNK